MQNSNNVPILSAVALLAKADEWNVPPRTANSREDQHQMLHHAQVTAQIATAQAIIELKEALVEAIDALREATVNLQG